MLPNLFIIDWDETITEHDTIALLADAAYTCKPSFLPKFDHFVNIYNSAYNKFSQEFQHENGKRDTIEKEIRFQKGLYKVDETSLDEICKLKLFEGVSKSEIEAKASEVKLREGFLKFLGGCISMGIPVKILSVNWSKILMKACLEKNGFVENENLEYIVNELEFREEIATGNFTGEEIRTGIDKLAITKDLKRKYGRICYIGDSSTDLLSMIESDIGIAYEGSRVIADLKSLSMIFRELNDKSLMNDNGLYVSDWHCLEKMLRSLE